MDASIKWKTGKRRVLDLVPSRPAKWPAKPAQRRELLGAWRYVAEQVLRSNRVNGCLLPTLIAETEWIATKDDTDGVITAGNQRLARLAQCAVATVKRLVEHYVRLGLLTRDTVLERREGGTIRPIRTLRHAFPRLEGITLPDDEVELLELPESVDARKDDPANVTGDDDWLMMTG